MDCRECSNRIFEYVKGELNENEALEIKAHIDSCKECADTYKSELLLEDILKELSPEMAVPAKATEKWIAAIKSENKRRKRTMFIRVFSAAAAALVLFIGVSVMINGDGSKNTNGNVLSFDYIAVDGETDAAVKSSASESKKATARIKSEDTKAAASAIESLAGEYGGSVEENEEGFDGITAVIPSDEIDGFTDALQYAGDVEEVEYTKDGEVVEIQISFEEE